MTKRPIRISDHALVRYLERIDGVDVDAARRTLRHAADLAGDHDGVNAVICGGVRFYLRNSVLTTVMPANRPDLRTGRQRKDRRRDSQ